MRELKAVCKIVKLFFTKKYTNLNDIAQSYTRVSNNYDNSFLKIMHKYNEDMLDELVLNFNNKNYKEDINILDLACGTGFNSDYISSKINCNSFTLVDISEGMLKKAEGKLNLKARFIESDMLSFLEGCEDNSYDIVICAWAIKYQNPHRIIKEVARVLNNNGAFAVIVNLKSTLPEIRSIYPKLIKNHSNKVNKIMLELPNPINEDTFNKWFIKEGFKVNKLDKGQHIFSFGSPEELVYWVTSTGALAGFDSMIDMSDKNVISTMVELVENKKIRTVTHKYVWGIFENEK